MGIAYRPEIDGLRAIAVLAVVLYHAGVGGAGFVGVDVFFVISGYLITSLLLGEWHTTQRIDLVAFYARRVRRIFPAAAVMVLATLGASYMLLSPSAQSQTFLSAGASLVFAANIFFQANSGGYFDGPSDEMPLLHLWSLSVEEQFYFLWPVLLIVVLRYRPAWLLRVIVGLAIASFLLVEGLLTTGGDAAFYQMPARFWELAAGGLIAALPTRSLPRVTAPAGVLLTLAACIIPIAHFPGVGALPAVAGAALVTAAVHGGASNALLASRPMVGIGLISYSLYLWHWPLLALYRATSIGEGNQNARLALCGVAVLLAIASYRYVEQPFRRIRWQKGRTVTIGGTVSASLALAACTYGLTTQGPPSDEPPRTCHVMDTEEAALKCAPVPQTRVAIWGDSMAYAWSPLAWDADPTASAFTRDACAPMQAGDEKCRVFNALAAVEAAKLDTVILAARWATYPDLAPLADTLDALGKVRRVVILGPTPQMREKVPRCIEQNAEARCSMARAEFNAVAVPVLAKLRALAAEHPNVTVVDLTDRFCTATTCPPVKDGVPLYWDTHHVTSTAARTFVLPDRRDRDQRAAALSQGKLH